MTNSGPRVSRCSQSHNQQGGSYEEATVSQSHGWSPGVERSLVLANYGGGVTPATAADTPKDNHTLRWDTNHPSASRFTTAFTGAVLDNNTGLVWEQAPDANAGPWFAANLHCVNRNVGGTIGWRLPSMAELASLIDPSLPAPFVPGTVFTGVQSSGYWSATGRTGDPGGAWIVGFGSGIVFSTSKDGNNHDWCVRGDMNADQY